MQYRIFPATGDSLSVLGFGAMGFAGWFGPIDDNDAIRSLHTVSLHTVLELAVNVIDTARAYGRSEQVVGAALRAWSGRRPFVATKVQPRGPQHQFGAPPPVEEVFPKGWVTESCERSLRELGLDGVDLLQLHLYWPTWGHNGYWIGRAAGVEAGRQGPIGRHLNPGPPARQRDRPATSATATSTGPFRGARTSPRSMLCAHTFPSAPPRWPLSR